ncbi:nitroreductase family protein [Pseudodesulfovibrio sediminis]|uniref:Nitroreductase n=1 Tax=Pseudodesulfovibrio sediminis TaxID=2810563 RepID=A0ABM8I365_9BACT|nr:nitroreductase family protein [Pseudodesulfovibrio sediminis]BCS87642.1 nitroreductase [Pseudodesulfovibrio sediminis]
MLNFTIDTDKCSQCGECAKVCLNGIIALDDGFPSVLEDKVEQCIGCQHCMAVCKPGALSVFGVDPADSLPIKDGFPDPVQMETLIMGRRSIRRYKRENVDQELIRHLLEVTAHAPTAVNKRPTRLTVVDTLESMDTLRELATKAGLKALGEGTIPAGLERIGTYLQGCESGEDVIFRNAPHLLVASAPKDSLAPMADCHIAMSYFELLANTHGLGTVWDGIAKVVLDIIAPDLRALLHIPEDHVLVCVMAFGIPDEKYHRTVQRAGDNIHRVVL